MKVLTFIVGMPIGHPRTIPIVEMSSDDQWSSLQSYIKVMLITFTLTVPCVILHQLFCVFKAREIKFYHLLKLSTRTKSA